MLNHDRVNFFAMITIHVDDDDTQECQDPQIKNKLEPWSLAYISQQ